MSKLANLDFFNKEIANIQQQLIDKLDNLVAGLTKVSDTELMQLAKQIDFFQEMDRLGYGRLLQRVSDAYDNQIASIFSELSKRELGKVSAASIETLQQLRDFEMTYLTGQARQYADQLKNAMLRGIVTGQTNKQIMSGLARGFGVGTYISSSETSFLIGDAFRRFSRVSTAKAYQDFPKTKFVYDGPFDSKTREVCQRALKEGELTQEQINSLGYVDFGSGGGYNCRHRWSKVF